MTNYWEILDGGSSAGYDANDPTVNLDGFFEGGNPYIFVISQKDFLRLDEVLHVTKTRLRLEVPPYDIVFLLLYYGVNPNKKYGIYEKSLLHVAIEN